MKYSIYPLAVHFFLQVVSFYSTLCRSFPLCYKLILYFCVVINYFAVNCITIRSLFIAPREYRLAKCTFLVLFSFHRAATVLFPIKKHLKNFYEYATAKLSQNCSGFKSTQLGITYHKDGIFFWIFIQHHQQKSSIFFGEVLKVFFEVIRFDFLLSKKSKRGRMPLKQTEIQ